MLKTWHPLLLGAGALLLAAAARAENQIVDGDLRYLVGAAVRHGPEYWGAERDSSSAKLMWALRWGRWRLSTSGASGLMAFGSDAVGPGPGASRELISGEHFKLGFGLRLDQGRDSAEAASTAGLPDVRRTLRGRLYASYAPAADWQIGAALNQDLLGRGGGGVVSAELSHALYRSRYGELTAGLGLSAADGTHMRSYFGVPAGSPAAQRLGRDYEPGAGLRDAGLGLKYTRAYAQRWVGYMTVGVSRLLGPAADSPLNQRTVAGNWSIGLAYRN